MEKKLLDESKATLIEEDTFIDGEIEAPSEPSDEVKLNAFKSLISDLIRNEFTGIEQINSSLSTLEGADVKHLEDIRTILGNVADEKNLLVGMLTKALELLDSEQTELMNAGIEQAENIISEPATDDLNK